MSIKRELENAIIKANEQDRHMMFVHKKLVDMSSDTLNSLVNLQKACQFASKVPAKEKAAALTQCLIHANDLLARQTELISEYNKLLLAVVTNTETAYEFIKEKHMDIPHLMAFVMQAPYLKVKRKEK